MTAIWLLFRNPLAQLVGAGLLFAASIVLAVMLLSSQAKTRAVTKDLAKSEAVLMTTRTELATCRADAAINLDTMAAQSAAVEALQAERDQAIAQGQKALKAAQRETEGYQRTISRLRASKPKSDDYCAQAHELEAELRAPR